MGRYGGKVQFKLSIIILKAIPKQNVDDVLKGK